MPPAAGWLLAAPPRSTRPGAAERPGLRRESGRWPRRP
nr:hypothetical protein [Tanacetum cinerariifolium]